MNSEVNFGIFYDFGDFSETSQNKLPFIIVFQFDGQLILYRNR